MFICVAYQFSASATRLYYHVSLCLSTTFFNFFRFVFALSKKALKTHLFQLLCYCRVQQPWIIYTSILTKVNTILHFFQKMSTQLKYTIFARKIVYFAQTIYLFCSFKVLSRIPLHLYSFLHHRSHLRIP